MPWFPDFANAAELARRDTHAAALVDPVAQYVRALNEGTTHGLETAWAGRVIVQDPHAGTVRGHRRLHRFVEDNKAWLASRHARVETIASTRIDGRAVVELLAHLSGDGWSVAWPVAVVAEFTDAVSVEFRSYCSQQPLDGRSHVRPPILPDGDEPLGDVVGRYHAALEAGDVEAIVDTFAPDAYYREPFGSERTHHGSDQLRSFFTRHLGAGGGIDLNPCLVTDDGVRCAVEFNCLRWGNTSLSQAGIAVHERDTNGLLAAVRVYDDIDL